jgi:DNA repair protein RAD57
MTFLSSGGIRNAWDLFCRSPSDLANKLKTSLSDAEALLEAARQELQLESAVTDISQLKNQEVITLADDWLDRSLGGGIQTGMLWEIAGEGCDPRRNVQTHADSL